jgi:DNA sulfur modification protein DndD
VLNLTYESIQNDVLPKVSTAMNDYFMEMIQADPGSIIRQAKVTEKYDIAVIGPKGRSLDPDKDLNGASRRALTMAFILALTEVSGVDAPNVIDTPLGMMSGTVKRLALRTAAQHSSQLVLLLTRSEIKDCEDIIDDFAGTIVTLSNTSHYPKMLKNAPQTTESMVKKCNCTHRQVCDQCERVGDAESLLFDRRA